MTLTIVIKQPWFDDIASGKKTTEYREVKPFWTSRLFNKDGKRIQYTKIEFVNGYNANAQRMITEYKGFSTRNNHYYIRIGQILQKPFRK